MFSKKGTTYLPPEKVAEIAKPYNDVVAPVLEQFRRKYYPSYKLWHEGSTWAIGFDAENDYGTPLFWKEVLVYLGFNEQEEPNCFSCRIHGKYERSKKEFKNFFGIRSEPREKFIQCGLSGNELERTLEKLYAMPAIDKT